MSSSSRRDLSSCSDTPADPMAVDPGKAASTKSTLGQAGAKPAKSVTLTTPLSIVKRTMPKDPHGCLMLGPDGVLRSFAADFRTVIGAAGLNPEQISTQLDELQMVHANEIDADCSTEDTTIVKMREAFKHVDGSTITDTTALFEPGPECRPPKRETTPGNEFDGSDLLAEDGASRDMKWQGSDSKIGRGVNTQADSDATMKEVSAGMRAVHLAEGTTSRLMNAGTPDPHDKTSETKKLVRTRQEEIARIEREQEERERILFDEIEREKRKAQTLTGGKEASHAIPGS